MKFRVPRFSFFFFYFEFLFRLSPFSFGIRLSPVELDVSKLISAADGDIFRSQRQLKCVQFLGKKGKICSSFSINFEVDSIEVL